MTLANQEGASLLIVDDDERLRTSLARAFERRSFSVSTASNYHEALEQARREPPELAVVDLRMEGPSGLELVRELKALDEQTRIVVVTGYGSIATAIDAMRLGAVYYLQKPADADDILAAFAKGEAEPVLTQGSELDPPSLERVKWEHMSRVLADSGGNVSEAARKLRMHRRSLQRMLQKYPPRE
jgi:two-component system response regulator RegA